MNEESFGRMFDINVKGVFLCAQACARQMLKQGGGVIINMSSESGKEGSQGQSAYSATKDAVDSFPCIQKEHVCALGAAGFGLETFGTRILGNTGEENL